MQFVRPECTGCDIEALRRWVSVLIAVLKSWDSLAYRIRKRKAEIGEKLLPGRNTLKLEQNKIKHENNLIIKI